MNPFITNKAKKSSPFKKPLLYICGFFGIASALTIPGLITEGKWGAAVAGLGLTLLCVLPIIREYKAKRERAYAQEIAIYLNGIPSQSIEMAQIRQKLPFDDPVKKIAMYIHKGYLTNVHLDWEHNLVVLTAQNKLVEKDHYLEMKCESCGAPKLVLRGRIAKCDYCGSPIVGRDREEIMHE